MVYISFIHNFNSNVSPLFLEHKEEIKKHILIYVNNRHSKYLFNNILKGQEAYKKKNNLKYEISFFKLSEQSFDSLSKMKEFLLSEINDSGKENKVFCNVTDCSANIFSFLSNLDIDFSFLHYHRFSNTYNFLEENYKTYNISKNSNIEEHITLNGFKIVSFTPEVDLKQRKEVVLKIGNDLNNFRKFKNGKIMPEEKRLEFISLLQSIGMHNNDFYIKGALFEEYIYWILKDLDYFDDIKTSVNINFGNFSNEIDIALIKNNHLYVIECKFRNQLLDKNNLIYKLNSILDNLEEDSKALLLSFSKQQNIFSRNELSRAQNENILLYNTNNFNKDDFIKYILSHT